MAISAEKLEADNGRELASQFGWSHDQLNCKLISIDDTPINIETASIEGEGAVFFGRLDTPASPQTLDKISLFGYHASCPWGVVADPTGIHLISSRWLLNFDWYRLPPIPWKRLPRNPEILQAFEPAGVRDNQPQRQLFNLEKPTSLLQGVDDALVDRLDCWREKAVRYSRSAVTKVDAQLQTLYAQLFVLRTVEDRGIDDIIPKVISAVKSPEEFDYDAWEKIFARAQQRIGSDLFQENVAAEIEPHILCGLINDLYFPRKVPGVDAKYDFSWISADVLGLAYEKYLSTILQPAPLPAQSELFSEPQRGVERVSVRKSAGAYYTPRFLTSYLAASCIDMHYSDASKDELPKIIDFSCGSGSFLVAAVDKVLGHLKRKDSSRAWARELIDSGCIVGIDVDAKAVTAARLHLWQRLIEEPNALPLPNLSKVIVAGDGLDVATWGDLNCEYDIVLGNPPYLATSMVSNRNKLEVKYRTAKGRYDFSSLFVEQAVNVLKQGGLLGLVIPNRTFINKNAEPVRDLLTKSTQLKAVVDFGTSKVFDADAYVGCIIAEKNRDSHSGGSALRVIRVRSLDPDFMAAELLEAQSTDRGTDGTAVFSYLTRQPGSAPWTLLSIKEQRYRVALGEVSQRLDSVATVAQGIRTGANDLFIVDVQEEDGTGFSKIINGLGEQWFIETSILEPVVFGSEVQRFAPVVPTKRIVYPYKGGVAISETELREKYPRAHEYLSAYQDLLGTRSSLKGSGSNYYELIRPRDEKWLRRPKLLIRDLAPMTSFALDAEGISFIVGGTAVIPADPEFCLPLFAYLNSGIVNSLVKQQTPSFRGDFQKFEPGVLSSIPVLTSLLEEDLLADRLSELAEERMQLSSASEAAHSLEKTIDQLILAEAERLGVSLEG